MLEKKKYTMCMSLMVFLVWCHFENMKKSPPPPLLSPNTLAKPKCTPIYSHWSRQWFSQWKTLVTPAFRGCPSLHGLQSERRAWWWPQ